MISDAKKYEGENLLAGCCDLHVHASPEVNMGPVDEPTTAKMARDMGMRAIVFKPLVWPTVRSAQLVGSMVPGIRLYGGVALNVTSGGLDPAIVDAAGRLGGKTVWMPTWSAANDIKNGGFSKAFKELLPIVDKYPIKGISVVDENGALRPEAREIVRLAKEYDMILSTGHISPYESKCLAKEAQACGYCKLVFAHPISNSVGATYQDIKDMVELGAWVEHTAIPAFSRRHPKPMDKIVEGLLVVGPEHTIITSDVANPDNPPGPIMLQTFLASLIEHGVKRKDIERMTRDNPAYLLNLEVS